MLQGKREVYFQSEVFSSCPLFDNNKIRKTKSVCLDRFPTCDRNEEVTCKVIDAVSGCYSMSVTE